MINKAEKGEWERVLYFYLDNGSNVCGLEFNSKNGEEGQEIRGRGGDEAIQDGGVGGERRQQKPPC